MLFVEIGPVLKFASGSENHVFRERRPHELQTDWESCDEAARYRERGESGEIARLDESAADAFLIRALGLSLIKRLVGAIGQAETRGRDQEIQICKHIAERRLNLGTYAHRFQVIDS